MDDFDGDEVTDPFRGFMSRRGEGSRLKPRFWKHSTSCPRFLSLETEVFGVSLFSLLSCLPQTLPRERLCKAKMFISRVSENPYPSKRPAYVRS